MKKTTAPSEKQYGDALQKYADAAQQELKLQTEASAAFKKLSEKYDPKLQDCKKQKEAAFETIESYAVANREKLFGDKQSIETIAGQLTFRKSPDSVTIEGEEDSLIEKLMKKGMETFVTIKKSLNKAMLKKTIKEGGKEADALRKMGIALSSSETFEIKP